MLNKIIAVVAVMALIVSVGIVGRMDYQMLQQEQAWQNSIQAIEMEQENIQTRIIELQGRYESIHDLYICQGILLDDVRTRLHFGLFEELEGY